MKKEFYTTPIAPYMPVQWSDNLGNTGEISTEVFGFKDLHIEQIH